MTKRSKLEFIRASMLFHAHLKGSKNLSMCLHTQPNRLEPRSLRSTISKHWFKHLTPQIERSKTTLHTDTIINDIWVWKHRHALVEVLGGRSTRSSLFTRTVSHSTPATSVLMMSSFIDPQCTRSTSSTQFWLDIVYTFGSNCLKKKFKFQILKIKK